MDEESLFAAAIEQPSRGERIAFLDQACGDDRALRERLDRLLAAYDRPDEFLSAAHKLPLTGLATAASSGTAPAAAAALIGSEIGPYKLLDKIGEGGMGVVFLAHQAAPVKRRVALKLIKPGMDSRACLARFEAERQALALMDHPHIAKVLDAGATARGEPYFVMELIQGEPITDYCDRHKAPLKERLTLIVAVCQAVQHAHQKGVIHRDLKPSNVLVTEYDGHPLPKIIDFGVAKAVQSRGPLSERPPETLGGELIGTLEYMSPEQADLKQFDIDTRSDIYSLGVLLYELLTGATPFDKHELQAAGLAEMLRVIREQPPPKPSTKLSASDALPSIAALRETEPAQLTRTVRGELDWIVMKALEKERERRYQSAASLADDLGRYLNDEHVLACPPSAIYLLKKFVRRNRLSLMAAALVAAALLLGTAISAWQAVRARQAELLARTSEARALREERRALAAAAAERLARQAEAEQRQRAEDHARVAESRRELIENNQRINSLVTNEILAVLRDVKTPTANRHALVTAAIQRLGDMLPAEQVSALHTAGNHFVTLKQFPDALRLYGEGLKLDPRHAGIYVSRGDLFFRRQEFERAASDYTSAIEHRRPDDPANEHLPLARRGLARVNQGAYEAALVEFRASFAESPQETIRLLAQCFRGAGITNAKLNKPLEVGVIELVDRYVEARERSPAARQFAADRLGEMKLFDAAGRHIQAVADENFKGYWPYYSLALLALEQRDQAAYRRACADMFARSQKLGDHEFTAFAGWSACIAPGAFDDYTEIIAAVRASVAQFPTSGQRLQVLGGLLLRAGQYEEARQELHAALHAQDDIQGAYLFARYLLAMAHYHLGRDDEAARHRRSAVSTGSLYYTWRFQTILRRLSAESKQLIEPNK